MIDGPATFKTDILEFKMFRLIISTTRLVQDPVSSIQSVKNNTKQSLD
jgi:hypothetical protein